MGVGLVVLVALWAGVGCTDDSSADRSAVSTTSAASPAAATLVSPAAFERRVATAGVVTINVHVPNEGNIAGTDLVIPYTEIAASKDLPADRSTPLAVSCRSGNMSASAVRDLEALGYTDIVELSGGFNAWKQSGRSLDTSSG
jgi:rhodanese-related sulfurtransferase